MSGWQVLAVSTRLTLCSSTGLGQHGHSAEDLPVLNDAAQASATLTGLPRTSTQEPSLVTDFLIKKKRQTGLRSCGSVLPKQEDLAATLVEPAFCVHPLQS